jgi:hypothetical protein
MPVRQYKLLQGNLNHCAGAQDLLLQSLAEWRVDIAVMAEPYFIPIQPRWAGDVNDSVAIITRLNGDPPLQIKERGQGYIAALLGDLAIVGVYFSPNRSLSDFEGFLDTVRNAVIRLSPHQVLIMGDLNAKSRAWGNVTTNARGRAVQTWALLSELSLLNRGSVHTCVRQQGGSVVDVSFATRGLVRHVKDWHVLQEVETLSDHLYIQFEITTSQSNTPYSRSYNHFPRWSIKKLDREMAIESAIVQNWCLSGTTTYNVDAAAMRPTRAGARYTGGPRKLLNSAEIAPEQEGHTLVAVGGELGIWKQKPFSIICTERPRNLCRQQLVEPNQQHTVKS